MTALPIKADQLAALQDEFARLDLQTFAVLHAEVAVRQVQADQLQGELAQLNRNIGGLEMRVKTLAEEMIPSLEREADQIAQSAGEFLRFEQAEDALDEVVKEYERRRERQPLETVLQNATRYEGDYQTAEARSPNRLREAKQVYSLKYDFGYDEDEDAALRPRA